MIWLSATVRHLGDRRIHTATSSPSTDSSARSTSTQSHFLDSSISRTIPQQETAWLRFVLPVGSGTGNAWSTPQPSFRAVYRKPVFLKSDPHTITTVTLGSTWRYLHFTCTVTSGKSILIATSTPVHRPISRVLYPVLYCRISSDVNLGRYKPTVEDKSIIFCDVTPCSSVELHITFWMNVLCSFSLLLTSLRLWRLRWYVVPKRRRTTGLHGITSNK